MAKYDFKDEEKFNVDKHPDVKRATHELAATKGKADAHEFMRDLNFRSQMKSEHEQRQVAERMNALRQELDAERERHEGNKAHARVYE